MTDRPYWCEICARKKECYGITLKPKCFVPMADRKTEPQICDTCRYYNSNIPCGSTPSACKEADKFAEEFVDGLKKLKPKDEPQTDCDHKCIQTEIGCEKTDCPWK